MDELMISGKRHISSRRAAKEYHYHSDYIGQLIRSGKIAGQKVGHAWYVPVASLDAYFRNEKTKNSPPAIKEKTIDRKIEAAEIEYPEILKKIPQMQSDANALPASLPAPSIKAPQNARGVPFAIQPEPKMLRYLPDEADRLEEWLDDSHIEEIETPLYPVDKKVDERPGSEAIGRTANRSFLHVSQYSGSYARAPKPAYEDEIEEIPVPLRITSRSPQPQYQYRTAHRNIYDTQMWIAQPVRSHRAMWLILLLLLIGAAVGAASYFGSMQSSSIGTQVYQGG